MQTQTVFVDKAPFKEGNGVVRFDPGFEITVQSDPIGVSYGPGVCGPVPELRSLEPIRRSLMDPDRISRT